MGSPSDGSALTEKRVTLNNGPQSVSFAATEGNRFRPEWFRLAERPMLRFKDHEFLNVGAVRVTAGELRERGEDFLLFGGEVEFAKVMVGWSVRVSLPADGGAGFTVTTQLRPLTEPVEMLEAMTCFELPYEYDGTEHQMTVMSQQPIYRFEGDTQLNGVGYVHPFWYYGKAGRAHLTYPSNSPMMCCRVANADGTNERCTMLIGNWQLCSFKDMFAQPTRALNKEKADNPYPDQKLKAAPGRRGRKFLIGALNWNTSLHKDPNVLVEVEQGLSQEVLLDFAGAMPQERWDLWLASGWERMVKVHFPKDGHVPAWEVARSCGAGWIEAAEWLSQQFQKPEGYPGFFYPAGGICVYAPGTRPKWDSAGAAGFCGQWLGPLSYLAHVWKDEQIAESTSRVERIFATDTAHSPEQIWTIGMTPQYCGAMRKARLTGVSDAVMAKIKDWVLRRTEVVLHPQEGQRRGDAGILAWDAFANLLGADLFDGKNREAAARELLGRINQRLSDNGWSFNCAAEGDLVAAGNARPFGHGIAMSANLLAYERFGDRKYLDAAEKFGNIMLGLHFITHNNSPAPDLDTRGWANGSNSGRDQLCNLPPWETAFALEQLAYIIEAGKGREGFYDVLWLFAHTGLAMFPKARTHKRLYTSGLEPVYRRVEEIASEREFYQKLPYLAYEEPWDQTMLAGYQGVEPLICCLFFGGGLVASEDDRVLALVPRAAMYDQKVAEEFTVHLWNPLTAPIETALRLTVAVKRGENWSCTGALQDTVTSADPTTKAVTVPPRQVTKVTFKRA